MSKLLKNLNEQQKVAVETTDGPVLILAGAGSGKTRVLTRRIAYILEQRLAYPEQILAVTFTNKAAGEMKERIAELVPGNTKVPWIGTFHSICIRILRRDGHNIGMNNQFTVYDRDDQKKAVKESMDKLMIDKKAINPNAVLSNISSAKNELVDSQKYQEFARGYFQEKVAPIYIEYQKILDSNQALDFDDIIMKTVLLFENSPEVLEKYQNLFKYIHVDEYQDTNHAQYVLVKLLAEKHKNICVVGDDDQSIYSWRGATIRNILEFEKDYSKTKTIKLEQNYRSSKKILAASNNIISQNSKRKKKTLWTDNDDGEEIIVYTALDEKDESLFVAQKIEHLINDDGVSPENIAILYRINAQSRNLEEVFLKASIPYRIIGNVRFYDRREIKDVLSFIKIIYNPADDISVKRIINIPTRGIGLKTIGEIQQIATSKKQNIIEFLLETKNSQKAAVKKFINIYESLMEASMEMNINELISFVIDRTGYIKSLEDSKEENQDRIENIKELISIASEFSNQSPRDSLENFLERVSLYEAQDDLKSKNEENITMMTIHSAKGLEFDHVFLVGMEEGVFPHSMSYTDPNEMEEERRLAYVAITRARNNLYMSHAKSRVLFGSSKSNVISRFIEDISEDLIIKTSFENDIGLNSLLEEGFIESSDDSFSDHEPNSIGVEAGMKVRHPVFGIGRVEGYDDSSVTIEFENHGTKELLLEYAKLSKV